MLYWCDQRSIRRALLKVTIENPCCSRPATGTPGHTAYTWYILGQIQRGASVVLAMVWGL